jgi:hypothetical protein
MVGYYLFDITRDFIMAFITSERQFEIFPGHEEMAFG